MWTCAKCGEMHEDHFDSCWNCAEIAEEPAPSVPAGKPRSLATLLPIVVGGALFGGMFGAGIASLGWERGMGVGTLLGLGIAIAVWVLFPYHKDPV